MSLVRQDVRICRSNLANFCNLQLRPRPVSFRALKLRHIFEFVVLPLDHHQGPKGSSASPSASASDCIGLHSQSRSSSVESIVLHLLVYDVMCLPHVYNVLRPLVYGIVRLLVCDVMRLLVCGVLRLLRVCNVPHLLSVCEILRLLLRVPCSPPLRACNVLRPLSCLTNPAYNESFSDDVNLNKRVRARISLRTP